MPKVCYKLDRKMKKIIQIDNQILRQKAKEVPAAEITSDKFRKIISAMQFALAGESDGVALAAPQIAEPWRIFVVSPIAYKAAKSNVKNSDETPEQKLIFINPKIIKMSRDKKLMEEGCLSVRPYYGKVRRSTKVTIEALDENGVKFEMSASGLIAQIFQHETDHLDGVLFIDKAKDVFEMLP